MISIDNDIRRRDLALCAILIAVAATLRFWNLTSLGLTHFDEGAYTMTGRWLASFGHEGVAFQPTFSPPLFPSLVGAAFMVFGVRDYVAIAVSAMAGALTVGLLYLIGKLWFGRRAGISAALMLATAEYHLIFSRLALTDATFTFLFWAALACLFQGLSTRKLHWYAAGGIATGLCWNTKYHGLLPLAITGLWLMWRALRGERPPWREFAIACSIAGITYVPWVVYVQRTIGYGTILRTHIEHSVGLGLFVTKPSAFAFYFSHWLAAPLLICAALGVIAAIIERRRQALFLLFVVTVFLALATLYLSFPRLVLPIVPAICLFAAYGLDVAARRLSLRGVAVLPAATALIIVWSAPRDAALLAMRTDAYRQAAAYIRSTGLPVISQLSKNYYFYEDARSVEMRFHTRDELEKSLASSQKTILAVDPIVQRLPESQSWFDDARGGRVPQRVFPIEMYEPVYYQGFDPTIPLNAMPRLIAPFRPGESAIEVYRIP
jgi:4-amino-4-deoxy-L-arabinose transferase-like glycosyltransferase